MRGWKTWVAAAGSMLWGAGGYLAGLHEADAAASFVLGGFSLIGIGHKLDKAAA